MIENLEVRKVSNGFVVVVVSEDDTVEYVFDTSRKMLKFVKEIFEKNQTSE